MGLLRGVVERVPHPRLVASTRCAKLPKIMDDVFARLSHGWLFVWLCSSLWFPCESIVSQPGRNITNIGVSCGHIVQPFSPSTSAFEASMRHWSNCSIHYECGSDPRRACAVQVSGTITGADPPAPLLCNQSSKAYSIPLRGMSTFQLDAFNCSKYPHKTQVEVPPHVSPMI